MSSCDHRSPSSQAVFPVGLEVAKVHILREMVAVIVYQTVASLQRQRMLLKPVSVVSYLTCRFSLQYLGGSSSACHALLVGERHPGIHRHTFHADDGE